MGWMQTVDDMSWWQIAIADFFGLLIIGIIVGFVGYFSDIPQIVGVLAILMGIELLIGIILILFGLYLFAAAIFGSDDYVGKARISNGSKSADVKVYKHNSDFANSAFGSGIRKIFWGLLFLAAAFIPYYLFSALGYIGS